MRNGALRIILTLLLIGLILFAAVHLSDRNQASVGHQMMQHPALQQYGARNNGT